jgi:hypothetical protein
MRRPPATTKFANELGRRVAYSYARRLTRLQQFGVTEKMRWFWLGAYEVSVGKPLVFEHTADDREAVKWSMYILTEEIERLVERSAKRLLDASWPWTTAYAGIHR